MIGSSQRVGGDDDFKNIFLCYVINTGAKSTSVGFRQEKGGAWFRC